MNKFNELWLKDVQEIHDHAEGAKEWIEELGACEDSDGMIEVFEDILKITSKYTKKEGGK